MENVCLMALIVVDSMRIMMEIMMMIMNLVLETQNFVQSVCAKVFKLSRSHAVVPKKIVLGRLQFGLVRNEM
jgi:predicted XRE-type DNA-binding protein